jgi:hypothetical protein
MFDEKEHSAENSCNSFSTKNSAEISWKQFSKNENNSIKIFRKLYGKENPLENCHRKLYGKENPLENCHKKFPMNRTNLEKSFK